MSYHQNQTREGYQWTEVDGLQRGIPTIAAIDPPSNIADNDIGIYDAIVIGAGYAGLTAARDLTLQGHNVLLLEARDRIGGRTWTSNIDGHTYEMGGTYIHWAQPNLWREIARYQMQKGLDATVDLENGVTEVLLTTPAGSKVLSQEEQTSLFASAFAKFINVDGGEGKYVMPFPHAPDFVPDATAFDQLSLKDRVNEIQSSLTKEEQPILEAFLVVLSGARLEDAGFYDLLRLWALCGYSVDGLIALCSLFKLHEGQSQLARKFFEEALGTQRLRYIFSCPVTSVKDEGPQVEVIIKYSRRFRGKRVICTIPHNVLGSIRFDPVPENLQKDVLSTPHVNKSTKVHAEVQPATLRTWMGVNYPEGKLVQATGEAMTPARNARLVCFGGAANPFQPEHDINETIAAVKAFDGKIKVKRLVFHNWVQDEYAKGGWSWLPPLMGTTRDLGVLREPHGKVHFANADWAIGWRGFIDGAVEEGTRAAKVVGEELRVLA